MTVNIVKVGTTVHSLRINFSALDGNEVLHAVL